MEPFKEVFKIGNQNIIASKYPSGKLIFCPKCAVPESRVILDDDQKLVRIPNTHEFLTEIYKDPKGYLYKIIGLFTIHTKTDYIQNGKKLTPVTTHTRYDKEIEFCSNVNCDHGTKTTISSSKCDEFGKKI